MIDTSIRLNLGCGNKKVPGFVGVDIKDADVQADIRHLPYADESVDEIMAIHVLEHFFMQEIVAVLKEWKRVLKRDGVFAVELPCFDKVCDAIIRNKKRDPGFDRVVLAALYGNPKTHADGLPAVHKWCWSKHDMKHLLEIVGYRNVTEEEPIYHVKDRDMRWVCRK